MDEVVYTLRGFDAPAAVGVVVVVVVLEVEPPCIGELQGGRK